MHEVKLPWYGLKRIHLNEPSLWDNRVRQSGRSAGITCLVDLAMNEVTAISEINSSGGVNHHSRNPYEDTNPWDKSDITKERRGA